MAHICAENIEQWCCSSTFLGVLENGKVREYAMMATSVDIGVHGVLVGHSQVYVTASLSVGK